MPTLNEIVSKKKFLDTLTASRLFSGLSGEKLAEIERLIRPTLIEYKKNDVAIHENTEAGRLALIVSGKLMATKLSNEGGKYGLGLYLEGDLLGLDACKSSFKTWTHTYTCYESAELLWFDIRPCLEDTSTIESIKFNLILRNNIENILADMVVRLHYHTDVLSTNPLRERIMLHLTYMKDKQGSDLVEIHMNRTQFASYLSVDRSTLSRELQRMRRDGLIETSGESTFKIL